MDNVSRVLSVLRGYSIILNSAVYNVPFSADTARYLNFLSITSAPTNTNNLIQENVLRSLLYIALDFMANASGVCLLNLTALRDALGNVNTMWEPIRVRRGLEDVTMDMNVVSELRLYTGSLRGEYYVPTSSAVQLPFGNGQYPQEDADGHVYQKSVGGYYLTVKNLVDGFNEDLPFQGIFKIHRVSAVSARLDAAGSWTTKSLPIDLFRYNEIPLRDGDVIHAVSNRHIRVLPQAAGLTGALFFEAMTQDPIIGMGGAPFNKFRDMLFRTACGRSILEVINGNGPLYMFLSEHPNPILNAMLLALSDTLGSTAPFQIPRPPPNFNNIAAAPAV